MNRRAWLLCISFGLLSACLLLIYFDADLENFYLSILLKIRLAILAIISIGLGIWFYRCTWQFVKDRYNRHEIDPNPAPPDGRFRDIHIAQYNHLNAENTRCRNQIWKTVLSVWGIYFALFTFFKGGLGCEFSKLSKEWFIFFVFAAAFCASVFHIFFENMAVSNQNRSRNLGHALGLINSAWTHQEVQEGNRRLGFQFSIIVFAALIWAPPFIMLVLLANQRS